MDFLYKTYPNKTFKICHFNILNDTLKITVLKFDVMLSFESFLDMLIEW